MSASKKNFNPCHFCQSEKVHFYPYIYAKATNYPKHVEKSRSKFRHVTGGIHWKIFATVFSFSIAGKYIENVTIHVYILLFRSVDYHYIRKSYDYKQPMIIKDYLQHGKNHQLVQKWKTMVLYPHIFSIYLS